MPVILAFAVIYEHVCSHICQAYAIIEFVIGKQSSVECDPSPVGLKLQTTVEMNS